MSIACLIDHPVTSSMPGHCEYQTLSRPKDEGNLHRMKQARLSAFFVDLTAAFDRASARTSSQP